jgi:undecaprenyl-diphosphatase
MSWDINLFNWIHGLAGWSVLTDAFGIFLAKYLAYILGFVVLVLIANQGNLKEKVKVSIHLVLAALISRGILTEAIRYFYERPRPFAILGFSPLVGETSSSFPSGHAAFFFALGFIILSINRKWGYWFLLLAFLNGLARVFVGVHYPSDILGGILTGLVAWAVIHLIFNRRKEVPTTAKAAPEVDIEDGAAA